MEVWIPEIRELMNLLLGRPSTPTEYAVLLGVAALALILGMYAAGRATGVPNLGIVRRLMALSIGVVVLMCAWIGMQKYLLPLVENPNLRYVVMVGVPLLAGMAVVIPLQQIIFRSAYVPTLIAFVSTLVFTLLLILLTNAVLGAVTGGEKETKVIEKRRDTLDSIINH